MTELAKLAWPEVQALLSDGCAAILPVGAIEAHGPHLPLDTDVTIAVGMARRAASRLESEGTACVVLPPVSYVVADYAAEFPGTLSLTAEASTAHVRDVLVAAARTGFAPLAVANGHLDPAHIASLKAAADQAAAATGAAVAFPDVTRRKLAERLTAEFRSGACHAGSYETSLVLADDPDAVRDDIRAALPPVDISLVDVIRSGKTTFKEGGGDQAYFGRPAEATAEEGHATFAVLADILVEAMTGEG